MAQVVSWTADPHLTGRHAAQLVDGLEVQSCAGCYTSISRGRLEHQTRARVAICCMACAIGCALEARRTGRVAGQGDGIHQN